MHTLTEIQQIVASAIDKLDWSLPPHGLYEPIEYTLRLGGKRLRPCLTLMAADLYDAPLESAIPAAMALEIFHNFTLLHDDVMDHADVRRGQPTVHRRWNENTAILSGDTMSLCAFRQLDGIAERHLKEVLRRFSDMSIQICEGQQYDMDFETRSDVSIDEYMEMIRLKTAVLIASALQIGAVLADAPGSDADALYDFGLHVGLAFQLKDDYLDVYGNPATFGKAIGGDILCNKKTFMLLTAFRLADAPGREALLRLLNDNNSRPQEKIQGVTQIYDNLNVGRHCIDAMEQHLRQALDSLERVQLPAERLAPLRDLANRLMQRDK
ncbi:MAG: polyprenyl synthetase family protein [Paludibacteraceae bacterium]|nr:polyprenyl synthetase family protein [Paludibacteraceae bacterium]